MYFFTATINNWKLLFADDAMKKNVTDSLQWMHKNNRARNHGFVIMPNHIHLLWSPASKFHEEENEQPLLAQKLDYTHFNPISGRWRLATSPELCATL